MDTKINRTPRQLAREYFNGTLTFSEYRERRARLIDDITAGKDREQRDQPSIATVESDVGTGTAAQERADRGAPAATRGGFPWLPVVGGLAVAGALAGWLLLSRDAERTVDATPSVADNAVDRAGARDSGPAVLDEFLSANVWDQDALAGLMLGWTGLREQERQVVRGSESFRVFAERLRERLLEQRALSDMDSEAAARERELLSLAEYLEVPGLVFAPLPSAADAQPDVPAVPDQPVAAQVATSAVPETEPAPAAKHVPQATAPAAQAVPVQEAVAVSPPPPAAPVPAQAPVPAEPVQRDEPVPPPQSAPDVKAAAGTVVEPVQKTDRQADAPPTADGQAEQTPPAGQDPCPATLAKTRRPLCRDTLADGGNGPLLTVLPAGRFSMGSTHEASEQPVREITIGRPFALSVQEVSVAEFRRFCTASGRHCSFPWQRDNDPAANVSWNDALSYAGWLSAGTGMNYRLPSEAEWEYAARGGITGDYPFRDGSKILPSDARFSASGPLTVEDRSVNINGFRLRHIIGNLREWVMDTWFGDYRSMPTDGSARTGAASKLRVVRGGCFRDGAYRLRSSAREQLSADTRDSCTGFRIARDVKR